MVDTHFPEIDVIILLALDIMHKSLELGIQVLFAFLQAGEHP